jgi:hypothetical protein
LPKVNEAPKNGASAGNAVHRARMTKSLASCVPTARSFTPHAMLSVCRNAPRFRRALSAASIRVEFEIFCKTAAIVFADRDC